MDAITKDRVGKYEIRIFQDDCAESPREWCNLGNMVCFHKRYDIGDYHNYCHDHYDSWEEMEEAIEKSKNTCVILPLYLYDHGGLTISTTKFSCQWDSGRIGLIYATKEDVYKEYGVKRITKDIEEKVINVLQGEVETYDQYLRGDVYRYEIYKVSVCDHDCEHFEFQEGCSGYYGHDECLNEAGYITNNLIEYEKESEYNSHP